MTRARPTAPVLGILVKTYPKVSETFILREMLGLERRGFKLHIFSLQAPTDPAFHGLTRAVRAPVSYVPGAGSSGWRATLAAHARFALGSPLRYVQALWLTATRPEPERGADLAQALELAHLLRQHGVGHLHAHFANGPAGIAELAHHLTGIGFSISAHAKDIYLSPPQALRRKLAKARFVTTCTQYNRHHLAQVTGLETVHCIYHGLDPAWFRVRPRPVLVLVHKRPLVLSVGRLRDKKGFAHLVRACRYLKDAGYRVDCRIVGYGPQGPLLEALIAELDLGDTVTLAGRMTHEQLFALYRRATLFVLPCHIAADGDRDGIPNVLLEAMALRLPVISTPVSGIPELIADGRNGLLVPPCDPAALAQAMTRLLDNPPLRRALAAAGRARVAAAFSEQNGIERLEHLLADALDGAPRRNGRRQAPAGDCAAPLH